MGKLCLKDRELLVSLNKISVPKHAFQITVLLFWDFSTYSTSDTQFMEG